MNERIRKLRKALDMTQQAFADKLGVKRNTVGQWECGINSITDQIVLSICREFNVSEEWLRHGTGEMFLPEETDEFDALSKKYGLSEAERLLVERYVTSGDKIRKAIVDFIVGVSKELELASETDVPGEPEDLEGENEKSDAG